MSSETITRSDLENILNAVLPIEQVDYVVEQGTSNGWAYRKWNSGMFECSRIYTGSWAVNTSSGSYGGYRSAMLSIPTYPITFVAVPTVTATVTGGTSQGAWVNHVEPSTTGGGFFLSCGASLTATDRNIAFNVVGKWK